MDIEQEYISNSEQDTIDFGKKIAKELKNGDVVILSGELGSGKTKFTEGVLTFYGLEDEISALPAALLAVIEKVALLPVTREMLFRDTEIPPAALTVGTKLTLTNNNINIKK